MLSSFKADGIEFSSIEQFMMYRKAKSFHDYTILEKILKTTDVSQIKKLGREVAGYDENRFDQKKWRGQNLLGYALMMVRERL